MMECRQSWVEAGTTCVPGDIVNVKVTDIKVGKVIYNQNVAVSG